MPSSSRLIVVAMFSIMGLLIGLALPAVNHAGQKKERIIKKLSFPQEPVKITHIKVKKGAVEPDKKFTDSDDDWLKGLTLRIENTSGKPINYISISLVITRPEEQEAAGRKPFGEWLIYGVSPIQPQAAGSTKPAPMIPPGGSTELTLSDQSFEENKGLLKRLGFPDSIERVELILQEAGFDDGTLWSAGELWQRDPEAEYGLTRIKYQISPAHQEQERIIKKQSNPNEPVRIAALKTKKGVIAADKVQRFSTDDEDWLKGLAVKVNNTSARKINFVSVRLTFPRAKDDSAADQAPLMHSIKYGRDPFHLKDLSLAVQYNVAPGASVDVVLQDDTYEMLRRVLKKLNYPDALKEIELLIETVGLDDGTVWDMGTLLRRDANPEGVLTLCHFR